jgi:cytochrome c peroxidase
LRRVFVIAYVTLTCLGAHAARAADPGELGRKIFFDPSLSASGRMACSTCHDPRYAYGPPPGKGIAMGGPHLDRGGTRAVPSLRYLHNAPPFSEKTRFADGDVGPGGGFTWDGRAGTLQEQARIPLLAANEMANRSAAAVVSKLEKSHYAAEFRQAFGADIFKHRDRAFEAALAALAAFQQNPKEFYPFNSKYDAFLRGELELTEQEERGVALFKDPAKGNCASCHVVLSKQGQPPLFTDFDFLNVGVPRNPRIAANADPEYYDLGLCGPTRVDLASSREYCGFFRAPTMRNVARRDVFFHNGVFNSLRDVLNFYNDRDLHPEKFYSRNPDGSVRKFDDLPPGYTDNVDRDAPLDRVPGGTAALTEADIDDLIAFLKTLDDGYVAEPQSASDAAQHSDEYAWRVFVALNKPAVAWESWPSANDIFRPDAADPGPWKSVQQPAAIPINSSRFEAFSARELPNLHRVANGKMVVVSEPLASVTRLTEIHMNQAGYEYIRARSLYNSAGQLRAVSSGEAVSFPAATKEVKAKWRVISEAERGRYYTMTVKLADGTERLYGLTALHLVTKDLPTWFWATFEHVDNPRLPGNDGWQAPSRDTFACGNAEPSCNRAPAGIGLEGTVWENYRLRGTLTSFVDPAGRPNTLANSELEAGMQPTSSCITCHSRAGIGAVAGQPVRLPIFDTSTGNAKQGFVGEPRAQWFAPVQGCTGCAIQSLDFVWSMAKAR